MKSFDIKEIPIRHRRILQRIASGDTPSQAAKAEGYTQPHVSRILASEAAKVEIQRLLAEAEARLVAELPELVSESLSILREQLNHPLPTYRNTAAMFILRYLAKPLLAKDSAEVRDTGSTIIELEPQLVQGGQTYESTRN